MKTSACVTRNPEVLKRTHLINVEVRNGQKEVDVSVNAGQRSTWWSKREETIWQSSCHVLVTFAIDSRGSHTPRLFLATIVCGQLWSVRLLIIQLTASSLRIVFNATRFRLSTNFNLYSPLSDLPFRFQLRRFSIHLEKRAAIVFQTYAEVWQWISSRKAPG